MSIVIGSLDSVIWEPPHIKNYLRSLRYHQRESQAIGDTTVLEHLLEGHRIDFESGEDTYSDTEVPLAKFLSLLDNPERLSRVSAVRLQFDTLSANERLLHHEVKVGAGCT